MHKHPNVTCSHHMGSKKMSKIINLNLKLNVCACLHDLIYKNISLRGQGATLLPMGQSCGGWNKKAKLPFQTILQSCDALNEFV